MEDWLDMVKIAIKYKIWLFGHFHADRIELYKVQQFYQSEDLIKNIWNRWVGRKNKQWSFED